MLLAYVDESGNPGYTGSATFSLGCVLVEDTNWPAAFDGMIDFRRFLRTAFGIRVRDEIKANWLVRNSGPTFTPLNLGDNIRRDIYRMHLRMLAKLDLRAFAVVIEKSNINNQTKNPRDIGWEYLLQRLERVSTKTPVPILLVHDEGDAATVRKLARKARRAGTAGSAFGTGYLKTPAKLLIDDPVPRQSDQSYFIQLADLVAYAAFRKHHPPPVKRASVCPQNMWDRIGTAVFKEATQLQAGQPGVVEGIVRWPT